MSKIQRPKKALIIRFSSLGDVVQSLSIPTRLKELLPHGEIHWITREEFGPLITGHPYVDRVWKLDRQQGLMGLIHLAFQLRKQNFTHVYDAHNNMRSHILSWLIRFPFIGASRPLFLRKNQKRFKRFLLFKLRWNLYEMPFSGQRDLLEPLTQWGLSKTPPAPPQLLIPPTEIERANKILVQHSVPQKFLCIAASSAHPLKRWPLEYWDNLIKKNPQNYFIILGGPQDEFLADLQIKNPHNTLNMSGKLSLIESASMIYLCHGLISNDTGLLHIAEQIGKKTIALMGPAPFGFPSSTWTRILERDLPCRPCSKHGKDPCKNPNFHECLRSIKPDEVHDTLHDWILH